MKFYIIVIVSLVLGSLQLYTVGQNVVIGLEPFRKTVNERDGPFKLCAKVLRNTSNDYNANVSVTYQDRSALGTFLLNISMHLLLCVPVCITFVLQPISNNTEYASN